MFSAWNMKFALIRRQKMQYSLPWYPLRVFCYGIMFSSRQLCFLNWKQDSCSHHSPHLLQLGNSVQFSYYLVSVNVWINVGGERTEACLELLASAAFVPTCLEAYGPPSLWSKVRGSKKASLHWPSKDSESNLHLLTNLTTRISCLQSILLEAD